MKIAKANELYFEVPNEVWYSFYNSPYISHKLGSAIDVYYPEKALFPLEEGKVKEIKKIKADFLIIIEISDELCLKVLHVKPEVDIGDKLYLGDEFGELISSGFFMRWSDRHAHFELRHCNDRYRAKGGLPIEPIILRKVFATSKNKFEVVERRDNYCWIKPLNAKEKNLTPLLFNDISIEGGFPHYKYGAIFGKEKEANIFGKSVLIKEYLHNKVGIFEANFKIFANGQRIKGIGIYCNQEKIKLIGNSFKEGDIVEMKILQYETKID